MSNFWDVIQYMILNMRLKLLDYKFQIVDNIVLVLVKTLVDLLANWLLKWHRGNRLREQGLLVHKERHYSYQYAIVATCDNKPNTLSYMVLVYLF